MHKGRLAVIVNGHRQYLNDLEQGGLELPAKFRFSNFNENIYQKMKTSVHNLIQRYREKSFFSAPKAEKNGIKNH